MDDANRADRLRQAANVVAAIFQVVAGLITPFVAGDRIEPPVRPEIQPADYAFVIWIPIFLLCLACAAYQALRANRQSRLLRRTGWFIAGALFCNGLFELLVLLLEFVPAQLFLVGSFLCAGVAYLRLARSERDALGGPERWLVALPVGLFFGWITAATVVDAAGIAVLVGLPEGRLVEAFEGGTLLVIGGLLARAVILTGKHAPPQGYLAYGAALLWALFWIVVAHNDVWLIIDGTALVSAMFVFWALFRRVEQ